jgi:hypothetical protein
MDHLDTVNLQLIAAMGELRMAAVCLPTDAEKAEPIRRHLLAAEGRVIEAHKAASAAATEHRDRMSEIKIGDVVPWSDVPDGALVRTTRMGWLVTRQGDEGMYVEASYDGLPWPWGHYRETATIVALGLTGQESADELRRLAEAFEVRS